MILLFLLYFWSYNASNELFKNVRKSYQPQIFEW